MGKLGREHLIDKVFFLLYESTAVPEIRIPSASAHGLGVKGNAVGKGNFITQAEAFIP